MGRIVVAFAAILASVANVAATLAAEPPASAEQLEFFEKRVRPLLAEHCYSCHSVKAERVEASLWLDSRKAHLDGGDSGAAIVPGDADSSLLIEAVRYESYEMPPQGKLPDEDIETLVQWVNMGAPWPQEDAPSADAERDVFDLEQRKSEHWAWQPIKTTAPPTVQHADWPRNGIDHYILARLEAAGLPPAADTDRAALLRRLSFDLTGLPPSPAELTHFLADDSPTAVENVVDRLLDSQHFGERWARHWLDLIRYAESRGHEFDNDTPNAFQYRDYVIRALNADVPYDQFVREHIAGDLLAEPRLHPTEQFNESVLGTGFWFLGEWVHSPVDIRKDEADRFDNMIDVMSKTFLGVTVACARCHDHKFDAISTADYYSLSGFLQSSDYRQVRFESMEQNRHVASQLASLDANYQRQLRDLLESHGIQAPRQTSFVDHEAIIFDYGNLSQREFRQDGVIYGQSPRRAGWAYWQSDSQKPVRIARHAAAVNDPIWSDFDSQTVGAMQNQNALAKLPKSGRTLRSPTFTLDSGKVACLIEGSGHIVACVDSHRLVAGPLHGQTIRQVQPGERWVTLNLERYLGHRLHLEFIPAPNAQLSVRMVTQGLDSSQLAALDEQLAAIDQEYTAYADAVESILNAEAEIEQEVFADFESGTYDGWTPTGEAFGTMPQTLETIAPYQGRINGQGKFFVNSHNIRPGGDVRRGDSLTGTLTSQAFTIDFETIDFLVGGGAHAGKTCVNLIVDGQAVRTATGRNNNQMFPHTWDVRDLQGRQAQIQIVDQHTAGWGNIGADHIVFNRVRTQAPVPSETLTGITATPTPDQSTAKDATSTPQPDRMALLTARVQSLIDAWRDQRQSLAAQIVRTSRLAPAMLDGTGEDDHILIRGNASKPGDVEPRHFLTAIAGDVPMQITSGSGRLQLAQHINDPANPLTPRVITNRIWHHLMGRGIVPTVDDFGVLGVRPTHPELLDHLAHRFMQDGRSIKRMIKYIVLSRTYQMSSQPQPAALAADPKNELWHHRPPQRLEGEAIRDALLAVSGRLDRSALGPPVPIHLTSFMDGRGRPGRNGPLDGDGRRSIYIAVRRNFLSPFMLAFDTPPPFSSMGRRNVSNVPAQALILLNDPLVQQLATRWGERALSTEPGSTPDALRRRIDWMYQTGFARPATTEELQAVESYLRAQSNEQGLPLDAPQLWANLAHVLVNTKEFIFLR